MIDNSVELALIVAVPAFASPLLMAWLTNRNASKSKEEDYARQDEVARKAEKAANALAIKTDEAARLLKENNKVVAATAAQSQEQLKAISAVTNTIHTLVNSGFTAALQAELDSREIALTMTTEVVAMREAQGQKPSVASLAAIESMRSRITELKATLTERQKQTELMKQQQDNEEKRTNI